MIGTRSLLEIIQTNYSLHPKSSSQHQ